MTLTDLQNLFPRTVRNRAATGRISMEFANAHQREIREICSKHGLRRIYRGPRSRNMWGGPGSFTPKSNAVAVMLYSKGS